MKWGNAAKAYCKVRLVTGVVVTAIVAVALIVGAFVVRKKMGSTSAFLPTEGLVRSGAVFQTTDKNATRFGITYAVDFAVGGTQYTAMVPGPGGLVSRVSAEELLKSAVGKHTVRLFYDPARPTKVTTVKHKEKYVMWGMLGLGALMIGGGAVTYALRDNPVMCGMQVASNVTRLFKND